MFVPHGRTDAEFRERRFPAEESDEPVVLIGLQPVLGDELRGNFHIIGEVHAGRGLAARGRILNMNKVPAAKPGNVGR